MGMARRVHHLTHRPLGHAPPESSVAKTRKNIYIYMNIYIYIYMFLMYIHIYVYMYIYIYI